MFEEPVGPVLEEHVTPLTPDIVHAPTPVGVELPFGPVTVAVKVKLEPRVAEAELVVTIADGADLVIARLKVALGPAGL